MSNTQEEKYSIDDFIWYLTKYVDDSKEKKWTQAEIAQLVARALMNFLPDTNTPY